ncbi:MAG: zinc-ribbon domain-containing protein [Thermoplasmata archaeon]
MVKYCPKCGTPNEDDALYCVKCGNRFLQMSTIETQKPENKKSEKIASTSPKYNKKHSDAISLLLILLGLLGIVFYIVTRVFSILFYTIIIIFIIYILYEINETYKETNQIRKELNQTLKSLMDLIKILEEKYAKGEITKEEFLQKKADLENTENKIKTQS